MEMRTGSFKCCFVRFYISSFFWFTALSYSKRDYFSH